MARFEVRNIEEAVVRRLRRRAKRHGRSLDEEVHDILRDAAKKEAIPNGGLGTEIASLFTKCGLDTDIAELHGHLTQPGLSKR